MVLYIGAGLIGGGVLVAVLGVAFAVTCSLTFIWIGLGALMFSGGLALVGAAVFGGFSAIIALILIAFGYFGAGTGHC